MAGGRKGPRSAAHRERAEVGDVFLLKSGAGGSGRRSCRPHRALALGGAGAAARVKVLLSCPPPGPVLRNRAVLPGVGSSVLLQVEIKSFFV